VESTYREWARCELALRENAWAVTVSATVNSRLREWFTSGETLSLTHRQSLQCEKRSLAISNNGR
jgi:hypothetical protein